MLGGAVRQLYQPRLYCQPLRVGQTSTEKTITKMDTDTAVPVPKLFMPHPNLSDEVNRNIAQSEIEAGVYLDNLSDGEVLEVETENRWYTIVVGRCGKDLISGHPQSFAAACWKKNRHGQRLRTDDPELIQMHYVLLRITNASLSSAWLPKRDCNANSIRLYWLSWSLSRGGWLTPNACN